MIRRSTWVTIVVFLAVLAFGIWWTRFRPEAPATPEANPTLEPIWEVVGSQIVGLKIEDLEAGSTVELVRQANGTWDVVQPEGRMVSSDRVEQAVAWLESPRPRSIVEGQQDLTAFGLTEPSRRVTVTLQDSSTLTLEVGGATPTGTTTYARFAGTDGVLVLSTYGLDEVLGLLEEVLATPTPSATAAEPTLVTPGGTGTSPAGSGTPVADVTEETPAGEETPPSLPSATPTPAPLGTGTASP
jgi:hypothetical protein